MSRQIFVNLATRNAGRSREFFAGLGWDINPQFSDEKAICVVISDTIYLMILTKVYFQSLTDRPIDLEGETVFSEESRQAVDDVVTRALASGGTEPHPAKDLGYMYYRAVLDPDGNRFSFVHLDSDTMG